MFSRVLGDEWLPITEELQRRVAREFGYGARNQQHKGHLQAQAENEIPSTQYLLAEQEDAVAQIRSALSAYPNDPDIKSIPLYIKYNRWGLLSPNNCR